MSEYQRPIMSNLSWENQFIRSWEFLGTDDWRLYFKPYDHYDSCMLDECTNKHGFKFAAIEHVSRPCDEEIWGNNNEVQFLFVGVAYFDGIRHLHFGTEQNEIFGYMNYPRIEQLIDIFTEVRKLELKFCNED